MVVSGRRWRLWVLTLGWLVLAFLIGLPSLHDVHAHWHPQNIQWIPFGSRFVAFDVAANFVFFAPFGALAAALLGRRRHAIASAVALAAVVSIAIEVSQVFSVTRYPSTTDVVCNAFGAWVGAVWLTWRADR
jgi:uncharacterized protein (TIGR03382 family)